MKNIHQGALGILAALLSVAVILGSISISLSENGLKLAQNGTATRPPVQRVSPVTQPAETATALPGETSTAMSENILLTATPTPMEPSATSMPTPMNCPPPEGWSYIITQVGDTLSDLAQRYNSTVDELRVANCLPPDELIPGIRLYVPGESTATTVPCGPPTGWVQYTVQWGDSLFYLSQVYGVTVADLQWANCLGTLTTIRAGQLLYVPFLRVPTRTPQPTRTPIPSSTSQPSPVPTETPSFTPFIPTDTPTQIIVTNTSIPPTSTYTSTPRATRTPTSVTPSPTDTSMPTSTDTSLPTPTGTPTPTFTSTSTATPTPTDTFTPTVVPSDTPTVTPTDTPIATLAIRTPRISP